MNNKINEKGKIIKMENEKKEYLLKNGKNIKMDEKESIDLIRKAVEWIEEGYECIGENYDKKSFEFIKNYISIKEGIKKAAMFLLFSHSIDEIQKRDAEEKLGVKEFIKLGEKEQDIWSNINPEEKENEKEQNLLKIKEFISKKAKIGDFLLIQGEWGYVFEMVNWAKENGYIPVYSATKRECQEEEMSDGTKKMIHYFKHVKYKPYFYGIVEKGYGFK